MVSAKHFLLRYSDKLAPPEGTISLHNKIIKASGYVWMGKFGRPVGQNNLELFNEQIKSGTSTYLFLVQKTEKEYELTVGELAAVSKSLDPKEKGKVPEYYRQKLNNVGAWFKVKKFYSIDSAALKKIVVANSGMAAVESMHYSMTGFFIVRLEQSLKEFHMKTI